MKKINAIFIFLLLICMQVQAFDVQYKFEKFQLNDKLPSNSVIRTFNDSEGYMWFGTRDGLCRFDGYDIKVFRSSALTPGILNNNEIQCIAEDKKKRIWIGTDKGLAIYDHGKLTVHTKATGLLSDVIWSICQDNAGNVILGTQDGIARFVNGTTYEVVVNTPNYSFRRLVRDGTSNFIYGATDEGVLIYNTDIQEVGVYTLGYITVDENTVPEPAYDVNFDKYGFMWITLKQHILIVTDEIISYTYNEFNFADDQELHIRKDRKNDLWIIPSKDLFVLQRYEDDLIINPIFSGEGNYTDLISDTYGNYWLSIYSNGLINYNGPNSIVYNTTNSNLHSNNISTLLLDNSQNLWIGSTDVGLAILSNIPQNRNAKSEFTLN